MQLLGTGLSRLGIDESSYLIQALAEARYVTNLIGEETGKTISVQPVVLFPRWFVGSDGSQQKDVWVLNSKASGLGIMQIE
jgi:hypothetical protein